MHLLMMMIASSRRRSRKLYTEGTENVAWVAGYSVGTGSQSKEADHLYLEARGDPVNVGERTYVVDVAVSVTPYSKLHVDWANAATGDGTPYSYAIVAKNKTNEAENYDPLTDVVMSETGAFGRTENEVDISGLSGDYYVRVHARQPNTLIDYGYSKLSVFKVWLER